jgi:hypothetical protein
MNAPKPPKPAQTPAPRPNEPTALPPADTPKSANAASTKPSKPIDPERPAEPVRRRDQWREGLEQLRILAHDRASSPGEGADWGLRSRLLDWMAEPQGELGTSTLWTTVLNALSATTTPGPSDDRARASAIRAAVEVLEEQAPLEITDLRLCRKVHGFGNYEALEPSDFKPGRAAILYCEMAGVRYEPSDEVFRSRLASQVEIQTVKGEKTVWSHPLGTAEDLCPRKRRDYFVNYRVSLPRTLAPGSYLLRMTQKDLISDRTVTRAVPLSIQP